MTDALVTLSEVEATEARCEAATPGPWHRQPRILAEDEWCVVGPKREGIVEPVCYVGQDVKTDSDFIAAARTDLPALCASYRQVLEAVEQLQELVDQQAEDQGLWFIATTAPEAYLQEHLRKLHAAIEDRAAAIVREVKGEVDD